MSHAKASHVTLALATSAALAQSAPTTLPTGSEAGAPAIDLWPTPRPVATTQPESVEERLRAGRRDRMARNVARATLTIFLPTTRPPTPMTAIVICPGGGYAGEAIDKEGYNAARRFNDSGLAAFVLKYRLPGGVPPKGDDAIPLPLEDARRAIRVVRARAGEWGVDPSRVGVMGFSAGGHLAGSLAVGIGGDATDDCGDAASRLSPRPDFAALLYPAISMRDPLAHVGSRSMLLGANASDSLINRYSLESNVSPSTPPIFLAHAEDDRAVPVQNA